MSEIVKYELDNGLDVQVTEQDVRDLLAAGGQAPGNVTASEIKAFLRLCQAQRLNPFTRDAYLVKYGSGPATIITGKEAFTKRASRNQRYRGMQAGVTVLGADGALHRREGSMVVPGEQIVGGWCKVHVDGYEQPVYDEVSLSEYNTGKGNWAKMPATMIRKVAVTHALREAFPEDMAGLYGEEEMSRASEPQVGGDGLYEAPRADVRPQQHQDEYEVGQDGIRPSDGATAPQDGLTSLRALFAEAKSLGIVTNDPSDPTRGLMGWVRAKFGCEVPQLSEHEVFQVEHYVSTIISERRQSGFAPEQEPEQLPLGGGCDPADISDYDIEF